jgi:thiamine biosynthesis protein ThiS
MIHIKINGKDEKLKEDIDITTYLSQKGIKKESIVVVINEDVVKKENFEKVIIKDGDIVEILRFVSGG